MTDQQAEGNHQEESIPEPVNVIDGVPDRSGKPAAWKYALIGLIFLAWVVFLVYCLLAGNVET